MNHRTKLHRTAAAGTVAVAAAACLFGLTAPASAATKPDPAPSATATDDSTRPASRLNKNGVCEVNELCLYYWQNRKTPGSGLASPVFDLHLSDSSFAGESFFPLPGPSADNNARSYRSRETSVYWRVYDGANYTGTELLCIAPGDVGNLSWVHWDKATSAKYNTIPC
jgi:hypothetical protein